MIYLNTSPWRQALDHHILNCDECQALEAEARSKREDKVITFDRDNIPLCAVGKAMLLPVFDELDAESFKKAQTEWAKEGIVGFESWR